MEFNFLENNDPNKQSGKQPENFSFSFGQNNNSDPNQKESVNEDSGDSFNFLNEASPSESGSNENLSDNFADGAQQNNAPVFEETVSDDDVLTFADDNDATPTSDSADPFDFLSDSAEAPDEPANNGGGEVDFNFAQDATPEEAPVEPANNGGFDFNFAQDAAPEEAPAEPASNGGFDFNFAQDAAPEEAPAEPANNGGFDFNFAQDAAPEEAPVEEVSAQDAAPDFLSDEAVEDIEFAPTEESDGIDSFETASEPIDNSGDFGLASAADSSYMLSSGSDSTDSDPSTCGFNKRVRTPDTGAEYNLSDLIDVETGLPLDLSSFQQPSADPNAATGVYSLASAPAAGGFSMSPEGASDSGTEAAPTRRRRAPKPARKSKNAFVELIKIVLGAVAGIVIAMYLAVLIAPMIGKGESNIPVPLPGLPQTYKHIPKDFPESMMWLFPGSVAEIPVTIEDNQPVDDSSAEKNKKEDGEEDSQDSLENDPAFNTDFLNEGKADQSSQTEKKAKPTKEEAPSDEEAEKETSNANASASSELGFVTPPQKVTDDQLKSEVDKVNAAIKESQKKITPTVCKALGEMALAATFVESNAESMKKVKNAMLALSGKSHSTETLGKNLNERLNDMEDEGGFIAVGSILKKGTRSGYNLAFIKVEGVEDLTVEYVGTKAIEPQEGDRVVFSGKILNNPAMQLKDFESNQWASLWGGIILVNKLKSAPAKAEEQKTAAKVEAAPAEATPAEAAPVEETK